MDIGIADPAWVAADDAPRVALAGFEGSLALLVDLARTRQIDLNQLPVADVVDQLMVALQEATIPLGRKGDWVVLAACLLLLRSRLLLPVETQPDAAATEDQLRDRLVALQAAQARRRLARPTPATGPRGVRARPAGTAQYVDRAPVRGRRHRVPLGVRRTVRR